MRRIIQLGIAVVAVGALAGGYVVADTYFFPEQSTVVSGTASPDSSATVLETGTFSGKVGHSVSGTVTLLEDEDGYYLQFENYRQTQGPDVYLTPAADPDTPPEIEAGRKILVDGGAEGGESTKEGTFLQFQPTSTSTDTTASPSGATGSRSRSAPHRWGTPTVVDLPPSAGGSGLPGDTLFPDTCPPQSGCAVARS